MGESNLINRYAVVSGSSRGIGREIAIRLARSGADIMLHGGHCQDALDQTLEEVTALGVNVNTICADLSTESGQLQLMDAATCGGRVPDIWVNNAGVDTLTGPLATVDYYTKLARLWEVDVVATIRLSRLVGGLMQKAGGGSIINIGWDQVDWGMEGDSGEIFCATKGAVMAFTRSLAKTLSPIVRVNCIAPGWIKTKWGETAPDDWQQRAIGESLLRRWGTAQDVAEAALFLASSGSAFITGQSIAVNGGRR